ncbi:hypothetical protein B0H13DRAFT_2140816 [Mycena leptocephala]|nr:hypothetical protein B0H13DRAFT_2140816 [Mycena leptocephala]
MPRSPGPLYRLIFTLSLAHIASGELPVSHPVRPQHAQHSLYAVRLLPSYPYINWDSLCRMLHMVQRDTDAVSRLKKQLFFINFLLLFWVLSGVSHFAMHAYAPYSIVITDCRRHDYSYDPPDLRRRNHVHPARLRQHNAHESQVPHCRAGHGPPVRTSGDDLVEHLPGRARHPGCATTATAARPVQLRFCIRGGGVISDYLALRMGFFGQPYTRTSSMLFSLSRPHILIHCSPSFISLCV